MAQSPQKPPEKSISDQDFQDMTKRTKSERSGAGRTGDRQ
jgi:hypothetical protein